MLSRYFFKIVFVVGVCSFSSLFYASDINQRFMDLYSYDKNVAQAFLHTLNISEQNALFVENITNTSNALFVENITNTSDEVCIFLLDNDIKLNSNSANLVVYSNKLAVYEKMVQKRYLHSDSVLRDGCIKVIMNFCRHEFLRCLIDFSILPSTVVIPENIPFAKKAHFTAECLTYGIKYKMERRRQDYEKKLKSVYDKSLSLDAIAKNLQVDVITMLKMMLAQCNTIEDFNNFLLVKTFNNQEKYQLIEHLLLLNKEGIIIDYINKIWSDFSFDTLSALAQKQFVLHKRWYVEKALRIFMVPQNLYQSRYPKNVTIVFAK